MTQPSADAASVPPVPSDAINFSINIDGPVGENQNDVREDVTREMPYDGLVSQIYIDIPDGVHSRAGFQIRDKARDRKVFPFDEETDWAAFNDVQDFWPVTFPLEKGDKIEIRYINEDDNVDSHLLKVWAIVVGVDGLPYTLPELAEREGVTLDGT